MAKDIVSGRKGKKREKVYKEHNDIVRERQIRVFQKNPNNMVLGQISLLAMYNTLIRYVLVSFLINLYNRGFELFLL